MTVPPVTFFTLAVSPTIICDVTQSEEFVKIESEDCTLRGSPYVVGLNGCYKLKISSTFSWSDNPDKKTISSYSTVGLEVDPPAPFKYFGKNVLETTGKLALSISLSQIGNAFVKALATDYERWATSQDYRLERAKGACPLGDDVPEVKHLPVPLLPSAVEDLKEERLSEISSALYQEVYDKKLTVDTENNLKTKNKNSLLNEILENKSTEILNNEDLIDNLKSNIVDLKKSESSIDVYNLGLEKEIFLKDVVTKNSLPFLSDDICLLPGSSPIVRVEEAPSNSRRIFTGVDIMADMEAIWDVLTAYDTLQEVVPSLVKNEVVSLTGNGGARLSQVGGAKVLPGVTFTAKMVLDVNIYKEDTPMPDTMLAVSTPDLILSEDVRAYGKNLPLKRGVFPRPYSLTAYPCRDITMQNVVGEGDFEHYQGVWRMQKLPNCAPDGGNAARLTYAVEIKPKGILPVKLIEGRIASDLKANMGAIRDFVEKNEKIKKIKKSENEKILNIEEKNIQIKEPILSDIEVIQIKDERELIDSNSSSEEIIIDHTEIVVEDVHTEDVSTDTAVGGGAV
eukprot:CAMPEP_0119040068 /NCGR_PEP_ID=MMETSP1177-20130426/9895_1 /TAXON_ID=2985 /ORGANISM="Ochromonas sp, Strain CCMP1899" /LENGTH=565 /DNA_ID=CAMNT_0007004773 /DNA_START=630 /DNA_END=2327 /DNA_ORIENTATION=+